jgi:hypothetical protein
MQECEREGCDKTFSDPEGAYGGFCGVQCDRLWNEESNREDAWMVREANGEYVYGFKAWRDAMNYARKRSGTPMKDDGLR